MKRIIRLILYATLGLTVLVLYRWHPEIARVISATIAVVGGWLIICALAVSVKNPYVSIPASVLSAIPTFPIYAVIHLLLLAFRLSSRFRSWEIRRKRQRALDRFATELHSHPYIEALGKEFGTRHEPRRILTDDIHIPNDQEEYTRWRGRRLKARGKKVKEGCTLEDCGPNNWDGCFFKSIPGPKILEVGGVVVFRTFENKDLDGSLGPYAPGTCPEYVRLDMQAYVDKNRATDWKFAKKPPEEAMKKIGVLL